MYKPSKEPKKEREKPELVLYMVQVQLNKLRQLGSKLNKYNKIMTKQNILILSKLYNIQKLYKYKNTYKNTLRMI